MNYSLQKERATRCGLDEYSCRGNRCSRGAAAEVVSAVLIGLAGTMVVAGGLHFLPVNSQL